MDEETKFHWSEGMKYVSEGIKSLFVLNGAATISVLTFVGNTNSKSDLLVYAMACFAFGAATGPVSFLLAYLTELNYGNATLVDGNNAGAKKFHFATYAPVEIGLILFLAGIALASCGLLTEKQ